MHFFSLAHHALRVKRNEFFFLKPNVIFYTYKYSCSVYMGFIWFHSFILFLFDSKLKIWLFMKRKRKRMEEKGKMKRAEQPVQKECFHTDCLVYVCVRLGGSEHATKHKLHGEQFPFWWYCDFCFCFCFGFWLYSFQFGFGMRFSHINFSKWPPTRTRSNVID